MIIIRRLKAYIHIYQLVEQEASWSFLLFLSLPLSPVSICKLSWLNAFYLSISSIFRFEICPALSRSPSSLRIISREESARAAKFRSLPKREKRHLATEPIENCWPNQTTSELLAIIYCDSPVFDSNNTSQWRSSWFSEVIFELERASIYLLCELEKARDSSLFWEHFSNLGELSMWFVILL